MDYTHHFAIDAKTVAYPYFLSCDLDNEISVRILHFRLLNTNGYTRSSNVSLISKTKTSTEPIELYISARLFSQSEELCCVDCKTHISTSTSYTNRESEDIWISETSWNEWIEFPVKYKDVEEDTRVVFEIWNVGQDLIGKAQIALFEGGSLRLGKWVLSLEEVAPGDCENVKAVSKHDDLENIFTRMIETYKKNKYPSLPWLDEMSKRHIEELKKNDEENGSESHGMALHIEFPNFDHPVVFEERNYAYLEMPNTAATNFEISNILSEDELATKKKQAFDWENSSLSVFHDPALSYEYNRTSDAVEDINPVAQKYFKLTRQLLRGLKDPNLKPDQKERERINTLIQTPHKISQDDQNLLWQYRYSLLNDKKALTKFVCSVDWDDENEVLEASGLLNRWKEIDIADALRLLSGEPEFRSEVVRAYAIGILDKANDSELLQYLLQLVQALRYDAHRGFPRDSSTRSLSTKESAQSSKGKRKIGLLAGFLISRASNNAEFASFFNRYLIVEVSDTQNTRGDGNLFGKVLGEFYNTLRSGSETQRYIMRSLTLQAETVKLVMALCNKLSLSREKGSMRQTKLRKLLSPTGDFHELLQLRNPVPIPLCPKLQFRGINGETAKVIISNTYPLVLDLILENNSQSFSGKVQTQNESIKEKDGSHAELKQKGYYRVMFKSGDDLRQDQLVLQMIGLMDKMFKAVNLDMHLTTYHVLALSTDEGMIEFVEDSYPVSKVLKTYGSIRNFFKKHNPNRKTGVGSPRQEQAVMDTDKGDELVEGSGEDNSDGIDPQVLSRFIKSCAGYCVITYILGVGDRHLDNLMLKPSGELFHIDFGYILGRDPKAYPAPIRLTREMIETMGGRNSDGFRRFLSHCCQAYKVLRRIPDISVNQTPPAALAQIQDKFQLHLNDGEAETFLLRLLDQSADALAPIIYEIFHRAAIAIK